MLLAEDTRKQLTAWDQLSSDEQTQLQIAYGHYLDKLPTTCSRETKLDRFQTWLRERGIDYHATP